MAEAVANEGPRLKRIRPAPMGRAFRYQRRLAHIIVTVAERQSADRGRSADGAEKSAATGSTKLAKRGAQAKPAPKTSSKS